MRFVVYGPERKLGVLRDNQVIDINAAYAKYVADTQSEPLPYQMAALTVPDELGDFIAAGDRAIAGATQALNHLGSSNQQGLRGEPLAVPLASVKLHPPFARRARLIMAGANYPVHIQGGQRDAAGNRPPLEEVAARMREVGIRGFYTFIENCIGPDEDIVYPSRTDRLDYEGEIAVVIGPGGKDIKVEEAKDHIWGYMLMNDVSARTTVPKEDNTASRFARDKNFDTSKPAGPCVVVGEISDPQNVTWTTKVNGEMRQDGSTKDMVFSFADLMAHMSEDMTLYPGDVISGGTTGGTANDSSDFMASGELGRFGRPKREPAKFLKPGDTVEISNPVLGTLRNRVVAKKG